jgi:F0F1-type ATP synthase assembly protein I
MKDDERLRSIEKSMERFQEQVQKSAPAATASYGLMGAILVLGGLGYAYDWWRGTSPWGVLVGLVLGLIVGLYGLAKAVWQK